MMIGYFISLFAICLFSLAIIPAYAEVTSLHADRTLYAIDMNIYFTGTVDSTDYQKAVNLVIHDSYGRLVLITGNSSSSDGSFQITVNTDDPTQFSLAGTYSATAFVNDESGGKTMFFDFSPNGTPIVHQMPATQDNTTVSQTTNESNTSLQPSIRLQNVLHEGIVINDTLALTKSDHPSTGSKPSQNGYDFKNILYPVMALCGAGIVGFILYRKKTSSKSGTSTSHESVAHDTGDTKGDYALVVLKHRLAKGEITVEEFKALKDVLSEP